MLMGMNFQQKLDPGSRGPDPRFDGERRRTAEPGGSGSSDASVTTIAQVASASYRLSSDYQQASDRDHQRAGLSHQEVGYVPPTPQPSLQDVLSASRELRAAADALIPSGGTKKWVDENYDVLVRLLPLSPSPVLAIAALHGAAALPKDERFGNNLNDWAAHTLQIPRKEIGDLKNAAKLLFTPRCICLCPQTQPAQPHQRTALRKQQQTELRRRFVEKQLSLTTIGIIARASDNLAEDCKHHRLEVIHTVLDAADSVNPTVLKKLIDERVASINTASAVGSRRAFTPSMRFHEADGAGFATTTSFARCEDQAEQESMLDDAEGFIRKLFSNQGLSDPLADGAKDARRWVTNNRLLMLGHQALVNGQVTANAAGLLQLKLRSTAPSIDDSAKRGLASLTSSQASSSAQGIEHIRANMVAYVRLEDVLSSTSNTAKNSRCFTNYGTDISLSRACLLAPQGPDHLAVIAADGRAQIHSMYRDGSVEGADDATSDAHDGTNPDLALDCYTVLNRRFASRLQRILMGLLQPYCAHPGCTVPAAKCQAHHLQPVSESGATCIENMALVCRYHHAKVDDSRSKLRQGHYDRDAAGIVYWQPHRDGAPREYNEHNREAVRRLRCAEADGWAHLAGQGGAADAD